MLIMRQPTTYRRDRLLVNALLIAVLATWAVGLALHLVMFALYGSLF